MSQLKLSIELVPRPLWGRDLAKLLPRKEWDRIRKQVYEQYNYRCGICGAGGRMICHEIWDYDDENHVQRLKGLIAICGLCNSCKHLGRSIELAKQGKLNWAQLVDHFCSVNVVSSSGLANARIAAFKQWQERNKYEWTQDFGEYAHLFEEQDNGESTARYQD